MSKATICQPTRKAAAPRRRSQTQVMTLAYPVYTHTH